MKKFAGDIIILPMCIKNHNIWCEVPEIQSGTDRIFFHFGPFFAFFPPPPPFPPPNDPENQNFEKRKSLLEKPSFYRGVLKITIFDVKFLRYRVRQMIIWHGSWNIRCSRQKFLSFWAILCLSAPWQSGKSKF